MTDSSVEAIESPNCNVQSRALQRGKSNETQLPGIRNREQQITTVYASLNFTLSSVRRSKNEALDMGISARPLGGDGYSTRFR